MGFVIIFDVRCREPTIMHSVFVLLKVSLFDISHWYTISKSIEPFGSFALSRKKLCYPQTCLDDNRDLGRPLTIKETARGGGEI